MDNKVMQMTDNKCKKPTPMMLVNEVSKLFGNYMREESGEPGMTGSYRHLLFHLSRQDGRTQLELSRLTHLKPSTVSVSLQKLERDGYVKREADVNDLRCTRVYLTEKGKDLDKNAKEKIAIFEEKVMAGIAEAEKEQMIKLLEKMKRNLFNENIVCNPDRIPD